MAIFNDSSDLQQYLINHNLFDYQKLINEFNIDIVRTNEMPETLLGLAVPRTRTIFINTAPSPVGETFVLIHELTHVLMGVESAAFYKSSYVSTRKNEVMANNGAFFILVREFINQWSIDKLHFNVNTFMDYYRIPLMYYFQIEAFVAQHVDEIFA
ncbi:hypothetical protein FC71_GL001022 [Latilactobacillus sakei subsp. carnosus DSM 15831]|uniref:ImmA/IrrE family metallo-endopeptidase n=1 Tax=Latilactobacillus sakei TaxID=1599 RepID=UPI00019CF8A4|nr:ImmA/IrrE family metallo-endopeptidase [Latilactobacillus sakei]KRL69585.1 hypothetical protein FC71_GL001022 [Latilactobacillus sakei subsp. carnosus DSM 15831]MCP8855204.1 ImmA/IrrE family metallo-endopeptidase [Latilactobacillus sakei]GEP21145.1 hypothetical protein LSA03nite_07330 [Latilactobacillus sakei subsp. carnosus]